MLGPDQCRVRASPRAPLELRPHHRKPREMAKRATSGARRCAAFGAVCVKPAQSGLRKSYCNRRRERRPGVYAAALAVFRHGAVSVLRAVRAGKWCGLVRSEDQDAPVTACKLNCGRGAPAAADAQFVSSPGGIGLRQVSDAPVGTRAAPVPPWFACRLLRWAHARAQPQNWSSQPQRLRRRASRRRSRQRPVVLRLKSSKAERSPRPTRGSNSFWMSSVSSSRRVRKAWPRKRSSRRMTPRAAWTTAES